MDLWATLGVSPQAGIGVLVAALAAVAVIVGGLLRRSRRTERVWVDLSGRR